MPGNPRKIITMAERRSSVLTSIATRSANKMLMLRCLVLQCWRFGNEPSEVTGRIDPIWIMCFLDNGGAFEP
jgi:hypothetical protein